MKRFALAVAAAVVCTFATGPVFAQAKPAPSKSTQSKPAQAPATKAAPATATPAPAAPAKFIRPLKGTAEVEYVQSPPKRVGNDIVTVFKIKNVSAAPIALLKIDEYWYDKKNNIVTGDMQKHLKPFQPGEIIEITMKSPYKADAWQPSWMFSHANGEVKPRKVKKMN